jgi:hypothetical protein
MLTENLMRTSCVLLLALSGGALWMSTPGCGGKLTNAETLAAQGDAAVTSGGATTGTGGTDNTGGTGGDPTGGTGGDPTGGTGGDPTGGTTTGTGGTTTGTGGTTTGTGGTTTGTGGTTTGTGGTTTGTGGTGGGPGGTGGTGAGGGTVVDASPGCPQMQPVNGSMCMDTTLICTYAAATCACMNMGGRRDGGTGTWACGGGTMDAGRGGRG